MKKEDLPCICEGNWRLIINESLPFFGKKYNYKGNTYIFCGVMHAEDDYYYCMWKDNDMQLLSCVGNIETYGFIQE
jgi:hypothetical protein